ncbi:MAG: tRNA (guanosine(37)-N1)-methyltransferase TrmD [Gaiellales bacterium]
MLELDVFTLFPHWFAWLSEERAVQNALGRSANLRLLSLRDFSPLRHAQVDDTPFGGGAGMLLRVDAVVAALEGAYGEPLDTVRAGRRIIALDPGGRRFDDGYARELATSERVTLLCGRYEGFDARILEHVATESLSLGPFVLSGGEPAAMAVIDAVFRLLPGALGDDVSSEEESFSPGLDGDLEYPHFTRPEDFRGWRVPDILLSGHHARIAEWRREQARLRAPDGRGPSLG